MPAADIRVTLPDGSEKRLPAGATGADLARAVGPGLAKAALAVRVDAPAPGVLVWSRTFFSAWWATLDGRPAPTVLADGHLLGVPVPAGAHRVEIGWSSRPVAAGGVLLALGLSGAALLLFRREPRAAAPA